MGQGKFDTFNSLGSAQFKINVLKNKLNRRFVNGNYRQI